MFGQRHFGVIAILLWAFSAAAAGTPWTTLARQMGRSEASRRSAVQDLRRISSLPAELRRAIDGKQRYLALEVITALGMKEMVPHLVKASSPDENGAVHLALTALVDDKNVREIESIFHDHLKLGPSRLPVVLQVILLDTLARMGTRVDGELLAAYFASPEAYVREAVLIHLEAQRLKIPSAIAAAAPKDPSDRVRDYWKRMEKIP